MIILLSLFILILVALILHDFRKEPEKEYKTNNLFTSYKNSKEKNYMHTTYFNRGASSHKVPRKYWVKEDNTWVTKVDYITYQEGFDKSGYSWKWSNDLQCMGWEEDTPPPEVTIICSVGMEKAVHEILKKNH